MPGSRPRHSKPQPQRTFSLAEVDAIGMRWSARVQNQIATINRLLKNGEYDEEMRHLHEKLAEVRAYIEDYDNWVTAAGHEEDPAILVHKLKEILEIK